jgi:hypothetical protein
MTTGDDVKAAGDASGGFVISSLQVSGGRFRFTLPAIFNYRRSAMAGRPVYVSSQLALLAVVYLPLAACAHLDGGDRGNEAAGQTLSYSLVEGRNLNAFYRDRDVAAHLLLRSGENPRILAAFPAGNSGVGLWFNALDRPATWRLDEPPTRIIVRDAKARALYGFKSRASINASRLSVQQAVLSNVRFLRDYESAGKFPAEITAAMTADGNTLSFARDRVDGAPGYRLSLRVRKGELRGGDILAAPNGEISLDILAASGDAPLSPLDGDDLLNDKAADDPAARDALRFLSYREKFLAGSWRFNTYFGRDTLMSARLLMPALQPPAIEAALTSVLARMSTSGEVAHEEGVSEFAILDRIRHDLPPGDAATLDYGMIDDDFMLAPVAARYLLELPDGRARASEFLRGRIVGEAGEATQSRVGELLVRNLRFVLAAAKPFAQAPRAASLVSIKPGRTTGQWRDSDMGLGFGRYPYDVNAVFIPACLEAISAFKDSGLLDAWLTDADRNDFAEAAAMAKVWREMAPPLFKIEVNAAAARAAVGAYAKELGVDDTAALASISGQIVVFHAVALDERGAPVPVMNTDEGFALLFGAPPVADLDAYVSAIMRPFPAGLLTDVGVVVANAGYGEADLRRLFTKNHYHGAVIWSWQQATLAAGLERQLRRDDLPADVRARLVSAQSALWSAIKAGREVRNSELWSWDFKDGRYVVAPFGADQANADESNAAQLWSTVFLAVRPPPSSDD